ncbi:phosphatidylserine decarboxylase [Microbulbifer sp. DLAB2-AA]|uniref:phosphatidylserine decarboxylase n=1 Tax=Microbulbifer sp. DLAB2-AA TaxID=3243394 RepID=UPI00403980D7
MKTAKRITQEICTSQEAIDFINKKASLDPLFFELLISSLQKASVHGKSGLDSQLYKALQWPTDIQSYIKYLYEFSRWIPQQSDNPAWKISQTENSQEVYDRLCHFYYLIDQTVGPSNTKIVQNIDWFSLWLVRFASLWGSFLDTPESFSKETLESFIKYSPKYRLQDSMIDGKPNKPGGWKSFNEFFSRELNKGLRPIAGLNNNSVVTSAADCTYRKHYNIHSDSTIEKITIKKTHTFASIPELLKGSKYANAFANGTFVHYFLGPYSYHRFHTPVAGTMEECYAVQGLTYLDVNLLKGQFDAPDNSEGGYEFSQARGIVTIDTSNSPCGDIGIVAVVPVGMCQVSSVKMTAKPGKVEKGDEFGYFLFGGSDIILIFQEGKAPDINTCDHYRHYGTDISICPSGWGGF